MNENEILKNFARALGAEDTLKEIEEKEQKQKKMLEGMAKLLGTETVLQEIDEKEANQRRLIEEKREREKKLLEGLNASLASLVGNNSEHSQIIEREILETIAETAIVEDLQPMPELPKDDIVTPGVEFLSKVPQKDIQQAADIIPPSLRKELDILKKSVADFHRLAQRHSQMGGGGEVRLAYLDDVNRNSIFGGNFLKYNASTSKFEFANVTSDGVDWKHIPSDMIPEVIGTYSLGNSSMRWESLWVGGNSATFSSNIYITSSSNTGITFNDSTFQNTAYIPPGYISTAYINANVAYTSTTTAYIIPPGSVINGNRNITLGSNDAYVIGKTGNYILNYSIQYKNTGADAVDIYVWVNKNNAHLEDSSTVFSVPAKKSTNDPGKMVAVTPIFFPANTGDLIQVMAATPYDTTVSMATIPAVVSPDIPKTPASIITITEIS